MKRNRDLIRDYFHRKGTKTTGLSYLDVGCGKGELLSLLQGDFVCVAGCDPSAGMLGADGSQAKSFETRVQPECDRLPYEDGQFDFVTAVCVYHHVLPVFRPRLTSEVRRVLKPGGIFSIIEHNPYNPITKLITSRTPVDADAILLRRAETRNLLRDAGFQIEEEPFFLYFPAGLYAKLGWLESRLSRVPLGGQYAVFGRAV
jgi:SAM-dependent methyltransferase